MSNLARQLFYSDESVRPFPVPSRQARRPREAKAAVSKAAKSRMLSEEDREIVAAVNTVRYNLECLHNLYDNTADELLVESLIYEIKAANMKYEYYLNLCKVKGIVCGMGR